MRCCGFSKTEDSSDSATDVAERCTSHFLNRGKYCRKVSVPYEFKTRLLERLKVIRHSSRASPGAERGETGLFRQLIVDQTLFCWRSRAFQ
jgi:hypothetical protein